MIKVIAGIIINILMLPFKKPFNLNWNLEKPYAINDERKTTEIVEHRVTTTLFRKNLSNFGKSTRR